MNGGDFEFLRGFLKEKSGYEIEDDKAYLLESRLLPLARRWRHTDIANMVIAMRGFADPQLLYDVVEAVMDYDTTFFRDITPFQHLQKTILPQLIASRKAVKKLRIWCAGVSSGQEAYSLAMMLKEMGAYNHGWKIEIIGTDVSAHMLNVAKQGIYNQFEVQRGLPVAYLLKYFDQLSENRWQLNNSIRQLVRFQKFNLVDMAQAMDVCDLVLCRNVLCSFDAKRKETALSQLMLSVAKDGVLVMGGKETLPEGGHGFNACEDEPCVYTR